MEDLSHCHKIAVQEIINAISIINQREGSSAADILYTLDKLHGKVDRPIIKQALKTAVHKGILTCHHGRFMICKRKSSLRKASKKKHIRQDSVCCTCCKVTDSSYSVPVRNYECNFVKKAKSTNRCVAKDSYSFREVERPLECQCCSDDEMSSLNSSSDISDCCCNNEYYTHEEQKGRKLSASQKKSTILYHQAARKNVSLKSSRRKKGNKRNVAINTANKCKRKGKVIINQNGGGKNINEDEEEQCAGESTKTTINDDRKEKSSLNESSTEGTYVEDPKGQDKPSNDIGFMGLFANLTS